MREPKTHSIDGFTYTITQLGAKQGRIVLARVMRVVASAAEATDPVAKLSLALTDAEIDFLCDVFAKSTLVEREGTGKAFPLSDVFDDHFAGRYGDMVKWLWAALETNYASFLSGMGLNTEALASAAKAALSGASLSSTPANPTSSSGVLSLRMSGP